MRKTFFVVCLSCASLLQAETKSFTENADLTLKLSQSNYNRLVVKGDKITKAFFPQAAMVAVNDEDGSLYVTLAASAVTPFTIFISTEAGRHFSATITGEAALGKTIEFTQFQPPKPQLAKFSPNVKAKVAAIPIAVQGAARRKRASQESVHIVHDRRQVSLQQSCNLEFDGYKTKPAEKLRTYSMPQVAELMKNLLQNKKPPGFASTKPLIRAIHLKQGLVLIPKETYRKDKLAGEIIEIYNRSSKPMLLKESWFADHGVKTIALSQPLLYPNEKVFLYRVRESAHG